jgi:hypothetical protein
MKYTKIHPILGLLSMSASLVLLAGCSAPLGDAAFRGDVETVRKLLDQGANVNEDNHWACSSWAGTALHCAAVQGNVEVAQLLIERGANVNAITSYGYTPLMMAAWFGHAKMVQLLLDLGSDPTMVSQDGYTAAKLAKQVPGGERPGAGAGGGHASIVRLLEQSEAQKLGIMPPVAIAPVPAPAAFAPTAPPASATPASDVDILPVVRVKSRENAYAVVIGIDTYRNKLPKADFASHDAQIMADYLTKAMGFEEENVAVLLNDRAAKTDLEKYIEHWLPKRVEPGATVFIYFSGHGSPNPKTGDSYLVPYDGDPAFVDATGYPLKRLYDQLGKLPAKEVVVMLDSCFSGAGGRSVIAKGMRPMVLSVENQMLASGKTVVLAASQGNQVSSTYDQKSHGLLTYYFLKGLQGEADKNKDGSIDLAEVFAYVKPQVERKARRDFNNEQTPQLLGSPNLLSKGVRLVDRPAP